MKKKSNLPIVDKGGAFATQVAARIISTVLYKFECEFSEVSLLFDTYPALWSDLITCDTELYEIGKSARLEYTIDFIWELLHEERAGVGRLCGKDGTPVHVKYPIGLDSREYDKLSQWLFEENVRYSRVPNATPLRSITDNFICGDSENPLICLSDNTVSAWYCPEHQCVKYIRARISAEDRCYKADWIYKSRTEIIEEMEMLLEVEKVEIFEKSGLTEAEFIKLPTHKIIEYCSNSAGLFICGYNDLAFDNVVDFLNDVIPCKDKTNYKDLDADAQALILAEVGLG